MKKGILFLAVLFFVAVLTACSTEKSEVVKEKLSPSQNVGVTVEISVSSNVMEITPSTHLIDYMDKLEENGNLTFGKKDGMLTSIFGLYNDTSTWKYCWMLYTDDKDNSSSAFGVYSYNGKEFQSANLGADSLPIKDGATYLWVYTAF